MDFVSLLRDHGLKSTPQRTIILSEIYSAGHIDVDSLHRAALLRVKTPLGTLYRALGELSCAGILKSLSIDGLKTHYEITKKEHAHFVCDKCKAIVDFNYDLSTDKLKKRLDLKDIKSVNVTVLGVCEKCAN